MSTIWFDFDGTLVNVKKRYVAVHKKICAQINITPLNDNDYWAYRCEGVSTLEILKKINAEKYFQTYVDLRNQHIESEEFLHLDSKQVNLDSVLQFLTPKYSLSILSGRSNYKNLVKQLQWLNILSHFNEILTVSPFGDCKEKCEILTQRSKADDIIVGDTPKDILAGNGAGIKTIAITEGMATITKLKESKPNRIIIDLGELTHIL